MTLRKRNRESPTMEPSPSLRVVRGPDWSWGDQDGGEGGVGTVVEVGKEGKSVLVQWDCGIRAWYRSGAEDKFDLRVFDTAPTGLKFPEVICCGCYVEGVAGMYWKCAHCYEYHLCHSCYQLGRHCQEHPFFRIQSKTEIHRLKVSLRLDAMRAEAKGVFSGAEVVRGPDWKFGDQDGGDGKIGRVVAIEGWQDKSARSVAKVEWSATENANIYRVGHGGKVDLRCTVVGSGGHYYPEHLPILGGVSEPDQYCEEEIAAGDIVKVELDPELFKTIHESHHIWSSELTKLYTNCATVLSITKDLRIRVRCHSLLCAVIPGTVCKVKHIGLERLVRIIDDSEIAKRLQQEHGNWARSMAKTLGQIGQVTQILQRGDVVVAVNGDKWIYNPFCLMPVPDDMKPPDTSLTVSLSTRKATALRCGFNSCCALPVENLTLQDGDVAAVRRFLERSSLEDHVMERLLKYYAKTGAVPAVKMLLDSGADPNYLVRCGVKQDSPLFKSVKYNSPEITQLLLDACDGEYCRAMSYELLHECVVRGHFHVLKVLTAHPNIDVNAQHLTTGETVLKKALKYHRTLCVSVLLAAGINPVITDHKGESIAKFTVRTRQIFGLEYLVSHTPEAVMATRPNEVPLLHSAVLLNCMTSVTFLLSQNPDAIGDRGPQKAIALHVAVSKGLCRMVECLVGWGADVNAVNSIGSTPSHLVFTAKGFTLGDSPHLRKLHDELVEAADGGFIDEVVTMVCFLAQEGANLQIKDTLSRSAAMLLPHDSLTLIEKYVKYHPGSFRGSLREKYQHKVNELPLKYPKIHQPSLSTARASLSLEPSCPCSGTAPNSSSTFPSVASTTATASSEVVNPITPIENSTDEQPDMGEVHQEEGLCMLCEEHPASVKFSPCGHTVLCSGCAERAKKCYQCRSDIQSKTAV